MTLLILPLKMELPFRDPVIIFTLVLFMVLLAPILMKRLRVPEIIVLLIAGVIVGPNGLNLLPQELEFSILGSAGLLYLMFMVGLEIDLKDFANNKNRSITFGFLTFIIPFSISLIVSYYLLNFSMVASLLISAMISTHTLIAYPIISRLGIANSRIVNITIGGTIIADTIALLILTFISESTKGQLDIVFWGRFIISFSIFMITIFWVFPNISKWFFVNYDGESSSEYVFVITIVFVSAVIAKFAHIEPIIGAFFAGLALNRLIPHSSPLMNRISFIGHTLFVPFFLISVGMLVDIKILTHSLQLFVIIIVLVVVAVSSKYISAFLTQKIFKYNKSERHLIFGLSNARAASAIAIVVVGYNLDIVHETILNATILLVLITSLISSLTTQRAGRNVSLQEEHVKEDEDQPDKVLVSISNPRTIERLINLSIMLKDPASKEPLVPFTIILDDAKVSKNVRIYNRLLQRAKEHASSIDQITKVLTRVDTNVADGIAMAVKEQSITKVVMGWHGKQSTADFFFGSLIDNLILKTEAAVYVTKTVQPLQLTEKIHILIPPAAEMEIGFKDWISAILNLSSQTNASITFWGFEPTKQKITSHIDSLENDYEEVFFRNAKCPQMLEVISKKFAQNDMLVVINARKNTLSYDRHFKHIYDRLDPFYDDKNIIIIYPEQENTQIITDI